MARAVGIQRSGRARRLRDRPERSIEVHPVWVRDVLERTDWLEQLRELAAGGRLALRVAGEYPPERAGEARRAMDHGGVRGRLLITFTG
ncbi:MAG TPA: hypothetical protein VHW04_20295 [Solirubrobacteraceae bacterium]|jgi:NADPH:quinone reductase-like Zn-dependent oxidoreductase|nr:hypothetical protein [Solirubrobacteraceae bacterium]